VRSAPRARRDAGVGGAESTGAKLELPPPCAPGGSQLLEGFE
jgi:hypothetical protein